MNASTSPVVPEIIVASANPITLTKGELILYQSVIITSDDPYQKAIIDAAGKSRVFEFGGPGAQTYVLQNLAIENGTAGGDQDNQGLGGAICSWTTTTTIS